MGNHRKPDKHAEPHRLYGSLVRAFAATGALALSVWALNLSGSAEEWTGAAAGPASRAASSANPGPATALSARQDEMPSGIVGAGSLPTTIVTAPQALVPFPRPAVGSYTGESSQALAVGAAGLGRPAAGFLRAPLELLIASSPFGLRVSPLSGASGDFHLGQDYAAPCGTKVYAADSGVVRAAGWHPWGGGNRVEIDHGNGLITTYNHLEAIAVRTGERVNVGQFIAEVGTTGWSTGCHLHFETILNGRHVSPLTWELLPLRPLADNGAEGLKNYAPGSGSPLGWLQWIIPVGFGPDDPERDGDAGTPATPASLSLGASGPAPSVLSPTSTSTPTSTVTPSPTSSETPSPSPTWSETPSPSPTWSETPTPSPTWSETPTPSPTWSETLTPTLTPTLTQAPAPVEPAPVETSPVPAPVEPAPVETSPAPAPVAPAPVEPTATPAPTEPDPTEPVPTEPAPTEPAPTVSASFPATD